MDIINNTKIKNSLDNIFIEHYDKAICWKKDEALENYFHLDDMADDEYFITNPFDNWKEPASNMALYLKNDNDKYQVLRMFDNLKTQFRLILGKN